MSLRSYFYYKTQKVAVIKSPFLGSIYLLSLLGILAYTIYTMVIDGGYLAKLPPVAGSVRLSAQLNSSFQSNGIANYPSYCTPGKFNNGGCLFWTANQIVYPYAGELNTIFITTRVSISTSPPPTNTSCNFLFNATTPGCQAPEVATSSKVSYYIANIEYLTLQIDHNVRAESSLSYGLTTSRVVAAQNMTGVLSQNICSSSANGQAPVVVSSFDDTYRKTQPYNTPLDVLRIGDLLDAGTCSSSGPFNYSQVSKAPGAKAFETIRSTGMIVSIPISYSNRQLSASQFIYAYTPETIDGSEFKITQVIVESDGSMTYIDRHGIRLVFSQTGSVGIFDLLTLILTLVAAGALVSLVVFIVDTLMCYALPRSGEYMREKYDGIPEDGEDSPDTNRKRIFNSK